MNNFEKWKKFFDNNEMFQFNGNLNGLLWLKVRAIGRSRQIEKFLTLTHIKLASNKLSDKVEELFFTLEKIPQSQSLLDAFLSDMNNEWYKNKGINEEELKEELYKVKDYSWGGDQNNSLDRYLVKHFVKDISNYEVLKEKKEEISQNAWNYVQTSWYNNWSSFLIESIFKNHKNVISAVGEIKNVDFFIGTFPFDLKVTFFPQEYLSDKVKERLGKKEVSWLKDEAAKLGIKIGSKNPEKQQLYILHEKMRELKQHKTLRKLQEIKKEIILETRKSSKELLTWLYENQGEMRFGSENRIFLILADLACLQNSWKLKRAFEIITPAITNYLDNFSFKSLQTIHFKFKNRQYQALASSLFILEE